MAASICLCSAKLVGNNTGSTPSDHRISTSKVDTGTLNSAFARETTLPIASQSKYKFVDTISPGCVRWASLAAAAAVSVSVLSATSAVLAAEKSTGIITRSIPGDVSSRIAIPIPDPDTWTYSQYGFIAPPPRSGGEFAVVSSYQGGCPAWQPSQFEMIVPDGVHPKRSPRHGSQWPALYTIEEASTEYPAIDTDSEIQSVEYASLFDALMRMSDSGLTCFSL